MMEMQSESVEPPPAPPCDPQPPGKINKAAFKLFGKRRTGSGMAGFFSLRNKGENGNGNSDNGNSVNGNSVNGNSVNGNSAAELVRSRTHDGLTTTETADGQRGEETAGQEAGPVRSLSKSLSFFSLLRRGSGAAGESGGARLGKRGRGLKGFFSSMRWRRKERATEAEGEVVEGTEVREGDLIAPEEAKDITLTLEPQPCMPQEEHGSLEAEPNNQGAETSDDITMSPTHSVANTQLDSPYSPSPSTSPLRAPPLSKAISTATATPPLDRCSGAADPPSEPSVDRLCSLLFTDVTSLKSFDSLTGCGDIIADAEEEGGGGNGGSATSSSSSGGGGNMGGGGGGVAGGVAGRPGVTGVLRSSTAKPPLSALVSHSSAAPTSGPARARMPPPPQQQPSGSGIVAYMGGGEEMASPDGVDDADMQGLWHMLPTTGDNSPALPRPHPNPRGTDRKLSQVKGLGLSKIPVVGGGGGGGGGVSRVGKPPVPHTHVRHPASPNEKEPLSDEGYWDTPTATPTAPPDDGGLLRNQVLGLTRDSCSGDALYALYDNQEEDVDRSDEEEEEEDDEEEDLTSIPSPSTGDSKLSPPSQTTPPSSSSSSSFRSMKGSTSLPRDSKIPVSVRQTTPPHSVSQSALSAVLEVNPPPSKTQAPPPVRTRIPISKVPVRRSGNKSAHRK